LRQVQTGTSQKVFITFAVWIIKNSDNKIIESLSLFKSLEQQRPVIT
jgi:hypothetical protein